MAGHAAAGARRAAAEHAETLAHDQERAALLEKRADLERQLLRGAATAQQHVLQRRGLGDAGVPLAALGARLVAARRARGAWGEGGLRAPLKGWPPPLPSFPRSPPLPLLLMVGWEAVVVSPRRGGQCPQ